MQHARYRETRGLAPLLALLLAAPAAAGVLVVDQAGGPGAGFTAIQAAVDAAASGDTVLVRDGSYAPFRIDAKALSVVADGPAVHIEIPVVMNTYERPTITVTGVPAGREVLVRGIRTDFGWSVRNCVGAVWFDDVHGSGPVAECVPGSVPGLWVRNAAQVTLTRCTLQGESGSETPGLANGSSEGLRALDATVFLYDCVVTGGAGGPAPNFWGLPPAPGAAGMSLEASTVSLAGCTITGGAGGIDTTLPCTATHAVGGDGVHFVDAASTVRAADSTAYGGFANLEPLCPGHLGPAGVAISGPGSVVVLPGFARHLKANAPVRGGETLTFEVEGRPGEIAIVFSSLAHAPAPLGNGVLLLGLPPSDMFVLGALPANGRATLSFPIQDVGPVVGAVRYYAQAAFLDPAPAVWLGAGTTTVLVDSSY